MKQHVAWILEMVQTLLTSTLKLHIQSCDAVLAAWQLHNNLSCISGVAETVHNICKCNDALGAAIS